MLASGKPLKKSSRSRSGSINHKKPKISLSVSKCHGSGTRVSGGEEKHTFYQRDILHYREQAMRKNTGEKSNISIMKSTVTIIYNLHIVRREMFDGPLHSTSRLTIFIRRGPYCEEHFPPR